MKVGALLVDDSSVDLAEAKKVLAACDVELDCATSSERADLAFAPNRHQLLIVDWHLGESSPIDGLQLAETLRARARSMKKFLYVILITGAERMSLKAAFAKGVDDFVKKGELDYCEQLECRTKAAIRIFRQFEELKLAKRENDELRGVCNLYDENGNRTCVDESGVITPLLDQLPKFARSKLPVLITGETGTGKELFARAIQQLSDRSTEVFVSYNCALFTDQLAASELFGHEKGAFTGADRRRSGCFQECNGGTLFLDEVAELPMQVQAMLLRVLQEGRVRRIGATLEEKVDVRVIAATNKDLNELIGKGKFREDLKFRLEGARIHVPPLRQRRADIVPLALLQLGLLGKESGRRAVLSPAAQTLLANYDWPGNIRELRVVLHRGLVLSSDGVIQPSDLSLPMAASGESNAPPRHRIIDVGRIQKQLAGDLDELVTDYSVPLDELAARYEASLIDAVHGMSAINAFKAKVLKLSETQYDRRLKDSKVLREQLRGERGT